MLFSFILFTNLKNYINIIIDTRGGLKMILAVLCCFFVFLGMYIGDRYDLKKVSINMMFGLFLINGLINILPKCFSFLSKNYHDMTFIYVVLCSILGFVIMKLSSFKYDQTDNISIAGFSFFNTFILVVSKFSFWFMIINILYYVIIGIYISHSKSWLYVFIGMIVGMNLGLFSLWIYGFLFSIVFSFLIYFIVSVYELVFRNNSRNCYIGLIIGMIISFLGGII